MRKFRSDEPSWNYSLVVWIVILLLLFAIFALVTGHLEPTDLFEAWGTWFGGAATSAAVIVALRISRRDFTDRERRDERQAKTQTQLYAFYLMPRLEKMAGKLSALKSNSSKFKAGSVMPRSDFEISHEFSIKHLFGLTQIDEEFANTIFTLDHMLNVHGSMTGKNDSTPINPSELSLIESQWDAIILQHKKAVILAREQAMK